MTQEAVRVSGRRTNRFQAGEANQGKRVLEAEETRPEDGDNGLGVVFKIETDGTGFSLLHEFAGGVDDGRSPEGSLTLSETTLYGMTSMGGDNGRGVIFSVSAPSPPSGGGGGGCFIATASYGSRMADEVDILKDLRDTILLTNAAGKACVNYYYKLSPPLAGFIAKHDSIRAIVRIGLVPVVGLRGVR